MILVKPSHEVLAVMHPVWNPIFKTDGLVSSTHLIELAGRTCYKSEDKITVGSADRFIKMIMERGHESVIEHSSLSVKFICDRGVTHEIVRHRLVAYSQESTRYCNYKGGVTFVIPPWLDVAEMEVINLDAEVEVTDPDLWLWFHAMRRAEDNYIELIKRGWSPQQARSVLPNSTKTEIVCTTNFREWRHILKLRCSKAAHPQMQELMKPLLHELINSFPVIFEDLEPLLGE